MGIKEGRASVLRFDLLFRFDVGAGFWVLGMRRDQSPKGKLWGEVQVFATFELRFDYV